MATAAPPDRHARPAGDVPPVFAAVSGVALGALNVLHFAFRDGEAAPARVIMVGAAESLVTLFFGFGCLTVAWLCVTVGLARRR